MSRHRAVRSMNYSDGMFVFIVSVSTQLHWIIKLLLLCKGVHLLDLIFFILHIGAEYDAYDDIYGHSVDDESPISPTDAQQWMYDRNRGVQSIASFITNNHDIKEETDEETDTMADELHKKLRRDSDVN